MRNLDSDDKLTALSGLPARSLLRNWLAAVAVAVVGNAVSAAGHADHPPRIDVAAMTGFATFDENSGLGNAFNPKDVPGTGPLFGATVGTRLFDGKVGAEAQLRVVASTLRSGDSSAKVFGWRLHGQYHLLTEGPIAAFATVGFGQEVLFNSKKQCPPSGVQPAGCMLVKTPDADKVFALGVGATMPLATRLSLRAQLLYLGADGRPGVTSTAHDFEGTVGVTYRLGGEPDDLDKDGLPDESDKCPAKAEDKDGFEDGDGCPEEDNDSDGVLDAADKCATVAEDKDGFEDSDGCPDPDNDGDGVLDAKDKCPDKPETKNGFQDDDGCPDVADVDGDGILQPADKCPSQPEDKDGFEDDDGCPELDNDRDGIIDSADKCPNQAETKNNYQDDDGCPDKLAETVARLFDAPVTTLEFKGEKLNKGSDALLTPLLEFMLEHETVKVHISVQADAGDDASRKVATARADAVKAWLTEQGIDAARVGTAVGEPPPAPPKTTKGVTKPAVTLKLL